MDTKNKRQGAIMGAVVGDALGLTHEFTTASLMPAPPYQIVGGGPFDFPVGAGSDDTDLLFCVLDAYKDDSFDASAMVGNMLEWLASNPPDIGAQTRKSLFAHRSGGAPKYDAKAQGNGGLMRAMGHAVRAGSVEEAANNAFEDTLLTHPSSVAGDYSAVYAAILYELVNTNASVNKIISRFCGEDPFNTTPYPVAVARDGGHCVHSFRLALWALTQLEHIGFEDALSAVIATGGDTDTNACIAGALLGARTGFHGLPTRWVDVIAGEGRIDMETITSIE